MRNWIFVKNLKIIKKISPLIALSSGLFFLIALFVLNTHYARNTHAFYKSGYAMYTPPRTSILQSVHTSGSHNEKSVQKHAFVIQKNHTHVKNQKKAPLRLLPEHPLLRATLLLNFLKNHHPL